jgi:outer membrane protein assembly factor BamB
MTAAFRFVLALALFCPLRSWCTDWPQFLGPTRNGVYAGNDLSETWPKEGPAVVWQKPVGAGFSAPAVVRQKLILFHTADEKETVECLDAKTGKQLWIFAYHTDYHDDFGRGEGPRATPCIADGRVYTFGADGMLTCLDFETGKKLWSVNTMSTFEASKGFFGMVCSPLVEGNAVLLNIGGKNSAGIVAFDKVTGKVLWQASKDEASYSSPIIATIDSKRRVLFLTRERLTILNPTDGKIDLDYPWRPPEYASVSTATPVIVDDYVFLSACYGAGAILLRIKDNSAEKIWSAEDVLSNHYTTSIYQNGFLYGIDGRTDPGFRPGPSLRCVEFKTGKLRWKNDSIGAASLTLSGDQLLILTEKGELIRARTNPDEFQINARAQILPFGVRAFPAIADGFLYARSKDKLVCVNLGKPQ